MVDPRLSHPLSPPLPSLHHAAHNITSTVLLTTRSLFFPCLAHNVAPSSLPSPRCARHCPHGSLLAHSSSYLRLANAIFIFPHAFCPSHYTSLAPSLLIMIPRPCPCPCPCPCPRPCPLPLPRPCLADTTIFLLSPNLAVYGITHMYLPHHIIASCLPDIPSCGRLPHAHWSFFPLCAHCKPTSIPSTYTASPMVHEVSFQQYNCWPPVIMTSSHSLVPCTYAKGWIFPSNGSRFPSVPCQCHPTVITSVCHLALS